MLAASSSRTGFVVDYIRHVQARLETASDMQSWMQIKMIRRWKFESYQKEQRAITKLATSLLGGLRPLNTIIVWGDGGFPPTSHGHAPAPNKKMQSQLSKHIPLVVGSEYRSSITSACHHVAVLPLKQTRMLSRRHTVMTCTACRTMLSRDANAAHVIADIFLEMISSSTRPTWITDTTKRNSNYIGPTITQ